MAFSKTKLELSLAEPILFFRGAAYEANGCFLRGDLMLHLSKPTKFKKIELTFEGIAQLNIPAGIVNNRVRLIEVKQITLHNWIFFDASSPVTTVGQDQQQQQQQQQSRLLPAGTHTYPFELLLNGDVPETVATDFSSIKYKLMAKATRASILPNLRMDSKVELIRTLSESDILQGINAARDVEGIYRYEISVPKLAYALGSDIPIDVKIIPYTKRFRIYNVLVEIIEKQEYKSERLGRSFTGTRVIVESKVNDFNQSRLLTDQRESDIGDISYQRKLILKLPKCSGPGNFTCDTPFVKIDHHLRLTFLVATPLRPGKRIAVRYTSLIILLSCRCIDAHLLLPKYEEESYYCPCDPVYRRQARLILGESAFPDPIDDGSPPPYESIASTVVGNQMSLTTRVDDDQESMVVEMMDADDDDDDDDVPLSSLILPHPAASSQ